MVLDILDVLGHATRFDEFIILSGDSDFTPVLLRLRAHDRRTSILTVGPAAEAYKAACDHVIAGDDFVEFALGISDDRPVALTAEPLPRSGALLMDAAKRLADAVGSKGVLYAEDTLRVLGSMAAFRSQQDWLGLHSHVSLVRELVRLSPKLAFEAGPPWRITSAGSESSARPSDAISTDLGPRIVEHLCQRVRSSPLPIQMAEMANEIIHTFGPGVIRSRWGGAGSFKLLLVREGTRGLEMLTTSSGSGLLLDPVRHASSVESYAHGAGRLDGLDDEEQDLATLARRVSSVTGAPCLSQEQYAALFRKLEIELAARPFHLSATSKALRDACIRDSMPVSRDDSSFVLKGLQHRGHTFDDPAQNTAWNMATIFADNVRELAVNAQLDVDSGGLLEVWLLGGFASDEMHGDGGER